jgi:outer membrane receptor for ferrienterochelin and colicin
VTNLGDKRLYRAATHSSACAASYNEVGPAYYLSLTGRF